MKKLFAVILVLGMLFLNACSEPSAIGSQESDETTDISQTESQFEEDSEKIPAKSEEVFATETDQTQPPGAGSAQSEPETKQQSKAPATAETADKEKDTEEKEEPMLTQDCGAPSTPAPDPKESKEQETVETPSAPTTLEPASEPTPESEPVFDISYWVSFAKAYGQQAGLVYDEHANSCWDNPILASPKSMYLERDITSRLSRYVREGMTAFCVWSEQLPDGRYNLYIGYA